MLTRNTILLSSAGQTALLLAMEHGDEGVNIIEALCDAGADINQMNFRKKTPLHIACMNQNHVQAMMLLGKKAQRRNSAFALLTGVAEEVVMGRIRDEDAAAQEALEELERKRKKAEAEGQVVQHNLGYKNQSPFGMWVDYIDKRDNTIFYYNRVSRISQRDKPKDFTKDKKRIVKETTFGHAFYH